MLIGKRKRGQLTLFIVLAIVILAAVLGYFLLRGKITIGKIPARFEPVQQYFLNCIEENAKIGTEILGERAGYIYTPDFIPGSEYMPTSSQLNFLGQPIPYWYYVSGNNIIKEQIPSKTEMENQLERYLEENLECDFSQFREKGFEIELSDIKADISISENKVDVSLNTIFTVSDGEEIWQTKILNSEVETKLGKFYDSAKKIYNYEKQNMFLENYAVDVLRLYAPVDGVELSCSPKIWLKQDVDKELKGALEANMQAIRFNGKEKDYFSQTLKVDENVNILYDRDWPTRIEVWDANNNVLMAEPVGNQPGLGILGFCYVPYHFVYDVVYPVLIRVYDEKEAFQFPVAVVIDKNKAREALPSTAFFDAEPKLCKYASNEVSVYTYNTNLEPVEADIGFECLGQRCDIGETKIEGNDAVLQEKFPSCLNGFISVKAEGYLSKEQQFSTNKEMIANIILDKLYDLEIDLKVDSKETNEQAIIHFISQDNMQTVAYPQQKQVKLSEGLYNISVFVYRNSSIKLPEIKKEICNEVPREGLLGVFGMTTEKCFDVNLPSQELTNVISGGGKDEEYLIENQLEKGKININAKSLPLPSTLEQLQDVYNLLEVKSLDISFG